jgi:RNA polymerase sigma factor (sigma-70 family)
VFFYLRASVVNGSRSRLRRIRVARDRRHTQLERDMAPAEQLAMIHLEHESVVVLLRSLPRRQREVLVLRHYDGATEAEIAETLGLSVGSVKTHASRGLHAVALSLEGSA